MRHWRGGLDEWLPDLWLCLCQPAALLPCTVLPLACMPTNSQHKAELFTQCTAAETLLRPLCLLLLGADVFAEPAIHPSPTFLSLPPPLQALILVGQPSCTSRLLRRAWQGECTTCL